MFLRSTLVKHGQVRYFFTACTSAVLQHIILGTPILLTIVHFPFVFPLPEVCIENIEGERSKGREKDRRWKDGREWGQETERERVAIDDWSCEW